LRQTDNIIFCFDGDKAGRKAAWRALENSLEHISDGNYLSFLFLPEEEDPDSYVNHYGKESFEQQLKHAIPLSDFLFKELCSGINLQSDEGRAELVNDAKPLLRQVKASALSLMLLKRLEELSGVSRNELKDLLQIKHTSRVRNRESGARKQQITLYHRLIRMLLYNPNHIAKLDRDLLVKSRENNEEVTLLKALVDFLDTYPHLIESKSASSILVYMEESPYKALLEKIESETLEWDDPDDIETEFLDTLKKIRQIGNKKRMTELHSKSLDNLTDEEKRELQRLARL
jgi:DNA primase